MNLLHFLYSNAATNWFVFTFDEVNAVQGSLLMFKVECVVADVVVACFTSLLWTGTGCCRHSGKEGMVIDW